MGNPMEFFKRHQTTLARVAMVAVFLGLIRCISEFFRLQYLRGSGLTIEMVKPFIVGSLVAAIGSFIMMLLSFYGRNKMIIAISVLTITAMLIAKMLYQIP